MLALNVSKEVLDAFVLVDNGLQITTEAFAQKNESVYSRFSMAYEQNPEKVGIWMERADEVQEHLADPNQASCTGGRMATSILVENRLINPLKAKSPTPTFGMSPISKGGV